MEKEFVLNLINADPTLEKLCKELDAAGLISKFVGDWTLMLNIVWNGNRELKMDKKTMLEWFQLAGIPSYMLIFFWRSISVFSAPVEEVGIHQVFFFLCALCCPHEGIWRFVRDYYIFAGFDTSEDKYLDLQEYQNMINCICFSNMSKETPEMKQIIKTTMSMIQPTNWNLSGTQWVAMEESGEFPCCKDFFRLPVGVNMTQFIQVRATTPVGQFSKDTTVKINTSEVRMRSSNLLPSAAFSKMSGSGGKIVLDQALFLRDSIGTNDAVIDIAKRMVKTYLLPSNRGIPSLSGPFTLLSGDEIGLLIGRVRNLLVQEDTILKINAPAKVFGDIRGGFTELLQLFAEFGSPNHYRGDIDLISYVFNGNFVDKGNNSIECICLLYSLKALYPKQIFLIRGNHEMKEINKQFGFGKECEARLPSHALQVWEAFNDSFNFLSLGGTIADKIFIVHGGIGNSFKYISDVGNMNKPIIISDLRNSVLFDVLWSDPTDSDFTIAQENFQSRGPNKFTMKEVLKFCEDNELDIIIRSHQCVPSGYEFFSGGRLITTFSATNTENKKNNGAILTISMGLQVRAKVFAFGQQ